MDWDSYISKKNIPFLATENPRLIDGTVTSDIYLSLLGDEFIPLLMGYVIQINSAWLQ
jgi:hypothetical protein